ncbi:phage antirepressor KilAC domain-containing protein [uncultured Vagococcus sp.]|uniref:phage antirepressor n=1 Tax=uncultured Vagococcus sp. TaxID=189676 RepID=UPI0028D3D753|nr:phage antirepressor KilAC domain-containing protein [uncultured Vagococcus sp.]
MDELQVINEQELLGRYFKVYGDIDNLLFLSKDVAGWIEHSDNSKMLETIDAEEKLKRTIFVSGQNRQMWFLTEDGLYEVLMQSRKPIAKRFKKEIKKILKDIRKYGMYATDALVDNPDLLIQVATKYKEEKTLRLVAEQRVNELQPKADYYDNILKNDSLTTISVVAKNYGMSANKLNSLLHDLAVQYRQGKTWLLYSKYQDKGYTHTEMIDVKNGGKLVPSTKWTQKGHLFIYQLLKTNGYYPVIEQQDIA